MSRKSFVQRPSVGAEHKSPVCTGAEKNTVDGNLTSVVGNGTVVQRVNLNINLKTEFTPQDNSINLTAGTGNGRFENGWIKIGSGSGTPGQTQTSALLGNGDDYVRKDEGIDIPALVSKTGKPDVSGKVIAWSGKAFTLSVSSGTLSTNYNDGTLNVAGVSATITTVNTKSGVNIVNVAAAPTIPFVLHDDDDDTGLPRDPSTGFMASADDIASNKLMPAYIRPKHDGGGNAAWNTHTVSFIRNTESPLVYVWDSRANNSTRFWVVYILSSFQDSYKGLTYDGDCNEESPTGGSTAGVGGSLIYLEQLRERYPSAIDKGDLEKRIVIHEVGHALKLDHGDGTDNPANNGIMNLSLQHASTIQMRFIDDHLDGLRKLNKPNN